MAAPGVEVTGLEEVQRLLDKIPTALFLDTKKSLAKTVLTIQGNTVRGFNGDPSTSLQTRSGFLQRSIKTQNTGKDLKSLRTSVFTRSIYGPIQEEGGTIKAKKAFRNLPGGPYLAIPSDTNKTKAGVTRFSPRDAFGLGAHIQKLRHARRAEYMIFDKDLGPLFWLVPDVTIKARLGLQDETDKQIPILIDRLDKILLEDL